MKYFKQDRECRVGEKVCAFCGLKGKADVDANDVNSALTFSRLKNGDCVWQCKMCSAITEYLERSELF